MRTLGLGEVSQVDYQADAHRGNSRTLEARSWCFKADERVLMFLVFLQDGLMGGVWARLLSSYMLPGNVFEDVSISTTSSISISHEIAGKGIRSTTME